MKRQYEEFAWRMGGPQGSGIDRLANVFGRALASCGLNVFGHREYHSNILGRHSYFDFCISPKPIDSHRESADILVTFDAESLCRHLLTVTDDGHVLFATDVADVMLNSLTFLDVRLKQDLRAMLTLSGQPATIASLLDQARHRGVQPVPIPYSELLVDLAHACKLTRRQAGRAINSLAVAASAALLDLPRELMIAELEDVFGHAPDRLTLNTRAVAMAYDFIAEHHSASASRLQSITK